MTAQSDWFGVTLSKRDLARVLKCCERTVERLEKSGLLPPRVEGLGRPRWSTARVLEWLRTGRKEPGE